MKRMQAGDLVKVEMTAGEWNQAMAVLAEGPYRVVAPLLAKIREQALAQDAHPGNGVLPVDQEGPRVPD
jgi:hypothetical protein